MRKYLLPENGNFYKANLHCHSSLSDGKKTPEELKQIYMDKGYSIVAYTDHDIFIPHNELTDDNFLSLNGFEIEVNQEKDEGLKKCCHICFIALDKDSIIQPLWHRNKYLSQNAPLYRDMVKYDENEPDYVRHYDTQSVTYMMNEGRRKGFFVTYNHPTWSRECYNEYMGYSGMHAMEMFNGGSISKGYEEYNPRVYDDMLSGGKRIFCVGGDDNHNNFDTGSRYCDSGWAFTVIKAEKLDYKTISRALLNGDFYASEGPEIFELWYECDKVYIRCSDADRINCTYYMRKAETVLNENDIPLTQAVFNAPPEVGYFRITVIDKRGRHACTNAYFIGDLK